MERKGKSEGRRRATERGSWITPNLIDSCDFLYYFYSTLFSLLLSPALFSLFPPRSDSSDRGRVQLHVTRCQHHEQSADLSNRNNSVSWIQHPKSDCSGTHLFSPAPIANQLILFFFFYQEIDFQGLNFTFTQNSQNNTNSSNVEWLFSTRFDNGAMLDITVCLLPLPALSSPSCAPHLFW